MARFLLWLGILLLSFNKNSMANKLKSEPFGKQFDYLHILRASYICFFFLRVVLNSLVDSFENSV